MIIVFAIRQGENGFDGTPGTPGENGGEVRIKQYEEREKGFLLLIALI